MHPVLHSSQGTNRSLPSRHLALWDLPSILQQIFPIQLLEKLQVSSSPQSFSSSLSLELLLLEQVLLLLLPGQVEQVQGQGWSVQSDLVGNIVVL